VRAQNSCDCGRVQAGRLGKGGACALDTIWVVAKPPSGSTMGSRRGRNRGLAAAVSLCGGSTSVEARRSCAIGLASRASARRTGIRTARAMPGLSEPRLVGSTCRARGRARSPDAGSRCTGRSQGIACRWRRRSQAVQAGKAPQASLLCEQSPTPARAPVGALSRGRNVMESELGLPPHSDGATSRCASIQPRLSPRSRASHSASPVGLRVPPKPCTSSRLRSG
jgi:hypothetical protein